MAKDRRPFVVVGVLAGIWWLLSDGDPASWVIGVPAVATAGWYAQRLDNGHGGAVSLAGLVHFVPFFFRESLRGGGDVALRTLAPRMRIDPGFSELRAKLQRRDARTFLVNCMNLLPGTHVADLRGDMLSVHLLDMAMDVEEDLRRLERAIKDRKSNRCWRIILPRFLPSSAGIGQHLSARPKPRESIGTI